MTIQPERERQSGADNESKKTASKADAVAFVIPEKHSVEVISYGQGLEIIDRRLMWVSAEDLFLEIFDDPCEDR
jgi:hypothetical protein